MHVSTPSGYEVDQGVAGIRSADSYKVFTIPMDACRGADLVTTDVWTSMGYEAENEARKKAFADWCVDADMMAQAKPDALFMHCLPPTAARRSRPTSSTARSRWCGTRPRTACTRRRP